MITAIPPDTSRNRPTVARLMLWILCAALLFGMAATLLRRWPFDTSLGGALRLGIFCGILYLPVIPGLILWKMRASDPDREVGLFAVLLLILCFFAWLGMLFLTFRLMLRAFGLL